MEPQVVQLGLCGPQGSPCEELQQVAADSQPERAQDRHRMSQDQLKKLLPQASTDTLRLNAGVVTQPGCYSVLSKTAPAATAAGVAHSVNHTDPGTLSHEQPTAGSFRATGPGPTGPGTGGKRRRPRKAPQLERAPGDGALGALPVQRPAAGRFFVRVTSVRSRLLDDDNLCEKYHVDCARYAGLLPGDGPRTTKIKTLQRQTDPGEAEHVKIEIFRIRESPVLTP